MKKRLAEFKTFVRRLDHNYHVFKEPRFENKINLCYYSKSKNLGDMLSPVIYDYMLGYYSLNKKVIVKQKKFVCAVGSLIGIEPAFADCVVWGSGILSFPAAYRVKEQKKYRKYDIRAVRGPVTKYFLELNGYKCPKIMGDPAILMPLIYRGGVNVKKKYPVSVISHFEHPISTNTHTIEITTDDYVHFIDEILSSELIVSSSLHGIILAESYGVQAVFINYGMDDQLIKFYDWYYSTGRYNVKIAKSLDEALKMTPMELPDLEKMRKDLIESFPVDLYK